MHHKKTSFLLFAITLIWVAGLVPILWVSARHAAGDIHETLEFKAEQIADKLTVYLNRYQNLPGLVARLQLSTQVLQSGKNQNQVNRFLYQTNQRMGSEAIFLLNTQGTVIASSNYQEENSFISKDLYFRPYFTQAINGQSGNYFAGGVVTGRRGYFFSEPVKKDGQIIGVAVVKLAIDYILQSKFIREQEYMVVGLDGVIFSSSLETWRFKTLFPLPPERRQAIRQTRRYGEGHFSPISEHSSKDVFNRNVLTLKSSSGERDYFVGRSRVMQAGWHIFTFVPKMQLLGSLFTYGMVYSLSFWLLVVAWLYRRKRMEIQQHIKQMNVELERRVEDLTGELTQSNRELQRLVDHYRETQQALEETQDQLVQAAKLAVLGEMSAGINHELSQPLLALQTYTENCGRLMQTGKLDVVNSNLKEMHRIIVNTGKMVSRFKIFSRRAKPELRPSPVSELIEASLGIMKPLLKKAGVEIAVESRESADASDCHAIAYCEPVQVEQVLINLMTNAAEALADIDTEQARITVRYGLLEADSDTREVLIEVQDNGPGLSPDSLTRIFEPFYTTKTQGLGIGLALSRRIIETQSGRLEASPSNKGGMVFSIFLPAYRYQRRGTK